VLSCTRCGYVYQTEYLTIPPPAPGSAYTISPSGPRDPTEWKVSAFLNWLGLLVFGAALLYGIQQILWQPFLHDPLQVNPVEVVFGAFFMLVFVLATVFFALRVRRLYVHYHAVSPNSQWYAPALVCGTIAAIILCLQLLGNLSIANQRNADTPENLLRHLDESSRNTIPSSRIEEPPGTPEGVLRMHGVR
jgi:magnesium-transporting ATPase (P-type)